ncbi:MAG: 3-deoxy-manno-octulosonate cytidylyltransferase [Nitrospirota bacterium]|jgi:3-deoxy-manno-octulosonate cytidylyltransferase (CMP-KDO synthetase)
MPALVVIPARYASTRFPGKALAPLCGKPLIRHVYENCRGARLADAVVVATDSEEIAAAVAAFGGKAVLTSALHATGTDRVAEAARELDYDIIVNVQGDEPLMKPEIIDTAIELLEDRRASIGTTAKRITSTEEILDPNVVKVALDGEGFALYFSRAPIPWHRDRWKDLSGVQAAGAALYKHIGIYAYRREALLRLSALRPTALEETERLEQLRALECGMKIKVGQTVHDTWGVDTPEDLEKAERWLNSSS